MNSDLDILLQPAKVKIIQLSCFSDLYKGDWMGNRVYDLQYIQLPLVTDLTDEEQDYFIKLAPMILGDSCKKPKFFNLSQWVEQGGTGLQVLWCIYYISIKHDKSKLLILYHFEVLHPLTYRYLIKYLLSLKDINTILLSTNATYLLDIHEKDCEKYIQLNNGFIVTVKDFVQLVKGKEEILTPIVYDVERMYRGYCSGKFPDVDTMVVDKIEKLNKERNDLDSEDYQ